MAGVQRKRTNYSRLKKYELIEICNSLGLKSDGIKKELINRIENFTDNITAENDFNDVINSNNEISNEIHDENRETNYNNLRNEQDMEYEYSLRIDRVKRIMSSIKESKINELSISDLKYILDDNNIDYSEAIEKYDLINLIQINIEIDNTDKENDEKIENDITEDDSIMEESDNELSKEDLRNARLRYYS
tara:strand:+ start:9716 stop:10288 length:573 start_codon:yes stop_codon:yes gene_type:complete